MQRKPKRDSQVNEFCEAEKITNAVIIPLNNVRARVAAITDVSTKLCLRLLKKQPDIKIGSVARGVCDVFEQRTHSFIIKTSGFPICNLRLWCGGHWKSYETNKNDLILTVYIDQLLITDSENKIFETLNMNSKIKGVYKNDILVLMVSENSQEIRINTIPVLKQLGQHFPISKYQSSRLINKNIKFREVNEHFQTTLNNIGNHEENLTFPLPAAYKNFVKLCLLDPAFTEIIRETQNIINCDILSKTVV